MSYMSVYIYLKVKWILLWVPSGWSALMFCLLFLHSTMFWSQGNASKIVWNARPKVRCYVVIRGLLRSCAILVKDQLLKHAAGPIYSVLWLRIA